ncbi:T9SS type A sorting domain-containing protein [Neolewinella persica]|uniref:T9SS type A sorting domain-containing protein n=1 Tax=Neolewinella persica TaxID=70998 RepID=UPI00035D6344|nr:T9SS type A sorting domain-containing protein [Neolewinella persica]
MKNILFFTLFFFGQLLSAQMFTEVPRAFPFDGVAFSSVAFSDIDGDGDQDVLITGGKNASEPISKLYINTKGRFTEVAGTPFEGVADGSIAFADVDDDGDSDVLITGRNGLDEPITKLYTNDSGSFTEVAGTPFEGVAGGSIAFADVDDDGDSDVLITGMNGSIERIAKLYTNDGGTFTEAVSTPFEGVNISAVAFADVDDDGDQDLLITGLNSSIERIAKLYTNAGGSFTEVEGTPFMGVRAGAVAFADIDNDGDQDLLIAGANGSDERITKLYTNLGGSFTEVAGTPFDGVIWSSIAFADVDNDGDQDVLITGLNNVSGERIAKLYTNAEGSFTKVMDTPFEGVWLSSVAFSDVDSDGDEDVLITGWNGLDERIAKLYTNTEGSFMAAAGTPFDGVTSGSVTFADVDDDGDKDVLITGVNGSDERIAKLYTNVDGNFTEVVDTPFDGVMWSSVAFSDVDDDGDNDVLITGYKEAFDIIAKLYINTEGRFTEAVGTPFEGVGYSSVAFSDVDGDGDSDVLITGRNISSEPITKLYANDRGSFTEVASTPFEGVESGSVAFADVDGDGDQDVLITGKNSSDEPVAKLYTNAEGRFTEVTGTPFDGVAYGSVAFSDVDGDGDQDLLVTGNKGSFAPITKLYTNIEGGFTEVADTPLEGVFLSSVAFSDVDGDGDNDVLITGLSVSSERITKLYTNVGGNFTELAGTPFDGLVASSVAFSDIDGDGDNDVLITGEKGFGVKIAKLYTNDGLTSSRDNLVSANSFEFTLYPNPIKADNLNIRYHSGGSGSVTIKVFDLYGRLLKQQLRSAVGQQIFSVNIASLKKGSYFIQLDDGTARSVRKFLVQ